MMNLQQMALNLIGKSPRVRNNPMTKQYLDVIQSGDSARGEQLANNLLKSYGMSKEDALGRAKKYFHI